MSKPAKMQAKTSGGQPYVIEGKRFHAKASDGPIELFAFRSKGRWHCRHWPTGFTCTAATFSGGTLAECKAAVIDCANKVGLGDWRRAEANHLARGADTWAMVPVE